MQIPTFQNFEKDIDYSGSPIKKYAEDSSSSVSSNLQLFHLISSYDINYENVEEYLAKVLSKSEKSIGKYDQSVDRDITSHYHDEIPLQTFVARENLEDVIKITNQLIDKHFFEGVKRKLMLMYDEVDGTQWVNILLYVVDIMTVSQIFDAEQLFLDDWVHEVTPEQSTLISLDYDI